MRRWWWLVVLFAAIILFAHYCVRFVPADDAKLSPSPAPRKVAGAGLVVPVEGVRREDLVDTFTQARGAGRPHDAIDIMAARGTPVIAAAPGTVEKLFFSQRGGMTIYVRSPDRRWLYYYAHLDHYRPGLTEQQEVHAGQVMGAVGSTGNADPAAPHLHFAINRMNPSEAWYQGRPINPYPLLVAQSR
jgi:murein DD-endopeptidase MepM/ murein hydrolase activator NlpD